MWEVLRIRNRRAHAALVFAVLAALTVWSEPAARIDGAEAVSLADLREVTTMR